MFALLGTVGLLLIEASYLPQIFRLWRRQHADELSLFFPFVNVVGRALALTYAVSIHEPLFTFAFTVGIVLRASFLLQVFWYRTRSARSAVDVQRDAAPLLVNS